MAAFEPLSVVIASKNRPVDIKRALASVFAQSSVPDDVIVIDQSDLAYDLSDFRGVRHIYDPRISGLTVARNRSIKEVRTPRVLFLDDDVELPAGALAALQASFNAYPDAIGFQCEDLKSHNLGRITGLIDAIFERGFFARGPVKRGRDVEMHALNGFGMAYRTWVFEREQFDEALVGYSFGEDWDFSKRVARYGRLIVARGAGLYHHHSAVNRAGAKAGCRMRWINYHYFFKKHQADRDRVAVLALRWWSIGESYRWLRAGLGLPSDQKAVQR